MKRLIIEFLGTFFLILTIAMTGNALAIAAMLMAWLYIGGYISGAHYNPLVTLAVAIEGKLHRNHVLGYMGAQLLGGFAAYAVTYFIQGGFEIPAPAAGVTLLQAFTVEVILSFVLATIILVVTATEQFRGSHIFGFAIGFTIPALAVIGVKTSGGLFNPAIAIGSHVFAAFKGVPVNWMIVGMYVAGALIGGALASCFFHYIFCDNKQHSRF